MKCLILAGGFATRLWPLSEKKAKPLLHVKDKPLISFIVENLPDEMEIIISTNAFFEEGFKKWMKNYPKRSIQIMVEDADHEDIKKGALGATAMAIEEYKIDEDILLIAGDNYFGFKMQDFIDAFTGTPLLAAYDIGDTHAARKFGVVVTNKEGDVTEFQEKPQEPKSTLVSTGCYVFPASNLQDIINYAKDHNDNLGGVFEYLLQKGETINTFTFDGDWYDIGSFDAYLRANQELISDQVIKEEGVIVEGSNNLEGGVYLGENTHITDSLIDRSIILKNCVIEDCVLRNCVIDEGSHLKGIDLSHQMIREGSRIEK
jgi:glucose-1-phosphate thymidylyltransferase